MQLKSGMKLKSSVCTTEIVVVRAPATPVDLNCGGSPMILPAEPASGAAIDPAHAAGSQVGKRYANDDAGLEVLCTKAGDGSLSIGGDELPIKGAKPLPSSD